MQKNKNIWYIIIAIIPAYSANNSLRMFGEPWSGLAAGVVIAGILLGIIKGIQFLIRKSKVKQADMDKRNHELKLKEDKGQAYVRPVLRIICGLIIFVFVLFLFVGERLWTCTNIFCVEDTVHPTEVDEQVPDHSTRVVAGGVALIVPAINGFRFPTERESGVYALVDSFILPKNRLLAALFTDGDLRLFADGHDPKFDDYFVLQIPHSIEDRAVTLDEFQPLRRGIRESQESGQILVSPTVKRQLAEVSKQTSDRVGVKITINITDPIPLGIFEDTESSIGGTYLFMLQAETHETLTKDLMLSASVATVVRGKLLYLNGVCTFHSMLDLSRCNSHVKAWLSALHAANP